MSLFDRSGFAPVRTALAVFPGSGPATRLTRPAVHERVWTELSRVFTAPRRTGWVDEVMNILSAQAEPTERQGRVTAPSLEAVRQAGDFALRMPVEHGGTWADATTVAQRLSELARACPSTSWNVGTSAVSKTLAVKGLGEAISARSRGPSASVTEPESTTAASARRLRCALLVSRVASPSQWSRPRRTAEPRSR